MDSLTFLQKILTNPTHTTLCGVGRSGDHGVQLGQTHLIFIILAGQRFLSLFEFSCQKWNLW